MEAGCLSYDCHRAADDPKQFLFHENWTSKAHLDARLQSAHLQALLPRVNKLCAGCPQVTPWERID